MTEFSVGKMEYIFNFSLLLPTKKVNNMEAKRNSTEDKSSMVGLNLTGIKETAPMLLGAVKT